MKRTHHIENPTSIEQFMRSLMRQKPRHEGATWRFMVQAAHVQAALEAFASYRNQVAELKKQIGEGEKIVVPPTRRTARNSYATEVA